ncbi:MAG: hypothetical protein GC189_04040 [Alphaproteobacteria bacterium]|nr:hypothetical protein [Alphaproteobacteria bacterium]
MWKRMTALVSALALVFSAVAISPAAADDHRGWRGERHHGDGGYRGHGGYGRGYDRGYYNHGYRHHDDDDDDDAIVAGVVGLALGAVLGAAISQNNERRRQEEEAYRQYGPPPQRGYGYQNEYREERTCYRRERQWDPYANRYLWVDAPYAC